ncbi:MAG TPA: LysR substrate-binding domain-containing protein [Caulobacteraceae bacterium]|jgi:LysR family hydrogen peroxide-inducible transcriptional activator|nr:LysR substrate-binding domain-containing protein [Caulobacteraceae bacterium]
MNLSAVSLRDLEYVVAIAEHGSFVKAAEQCHVAQPSLSVQVSKLEARLGIVIFERTTRRLIVTPEGRVLIAQMRKVLLEARNLLAMAKQSTKPFGDGLRLSAIATLGPYYFPRVLGGLRARYAELSLILGEGRTDELTTGLLRGDLDAVLMAEPVAEPGLVAAPLFREPFVLACPIGHTAASGVTVGWKDLEPRERLVLEEGHCLRDQALAACSGVDPSNRHATSLETLKYMVAAGEGCTLMPALAANQDPGLAYRPLPQAEYGRTIVLAWRASDPRAEAFELLAGHLRERNPEGVEPLAAGA